MVNHQQIALPKVSFPVLKMVGPNQSTNYHNYRDMAKSFFIQHKLFGIVSGHQPNPAGNVLPQSYDGEIHLADGSILEDGARDEPSPIWSDEIKDIWEWNRKHTLVYGFLKGSLTEFPAAYSKVIDCVTAQEIWTTLEKDYGQSSNVMLRVLESQLTTLFKDDNTSMSDHVDQYSQLIEQINYNLKPGERWSNERINRTFFGTLDSEKWGAYEDGLGDAINVMLPTDLYARIKARDAAKRQNQQRQVTTVNNGGKEANYANKDKDLKSRIGRRGRKRGKRGQNGNKSSDNSHHPYRHPDKDYVKRMKQQWGDDYIECSHCHFPGHTANACRRRSNNNKNSNQRGNNGGNRLPPFNGVKEANITEYEALSFERSSNDPFL
jgi:hypothetical protein